MLPLQLCLTCSRHVRQVDATCPFCGAAVFRRRSAAWAAAAALVVSVSACAAYGGPASPWPVDDAGDDDASDAGDSEASSQSD